MTDNQPLPVVTMKKAVRGMCYISHPLRLKILEYIDVNGESCVSAVTKALNEEQAIFLFIMIFAKNIRPAFLPVSASCSAI